MSIPIINGCHTTGSGSNNYKDETLQIVTSFQTTLNEKDIAIFFRNTANRYLSHAKYYHCDYEVSFNRNEQNFAWHCKITKVTYRWGILYFIELHTMNGIFTIITSNTNFINSKEIITFRRMSTGWGHIVADINRNIMSFFDESLIALRQNNRTPNEMVLEAMKELNFLN